MNEKELIDRLRQKDESALSDFVRNYLPRVFQLSLRLCKRESDANDLCQDVFVHALRGLKNFRGDAQLSTWLHRITVNTWKNRVRHDKRRRASDHISIDGDSRHNEESPGIDVADNTPSPDAWYEKSESHRQILSALDKLDADEKSIIVLRDIEMRPYDEIALVLDINLGTVKSRLARARERLREMCYRMRINKP